MLINLYIFPLTKHLGNLEYFGQKHLGNLEYFGQKHLGNLEYLFI